MPIRPVLATAGLVVADATALAGASPAAGRAAHDLGSVRAAVDGAGVDRFVADLAAGALWVVAAWLALVLLAGAAGHLPGASGRLARGIGRRVLPAAVRRVLAGSAGLGVLLAPVAAGASVTAAGQADPTAVAARPVSAAVDNRPSADPVPAPVWPSSPAPAPAWPHNGPSSPRHEPPRHAPPTSTDPSDGATVTVERGDSLWLIAARRLGGHPSAARIATTWPRWYSANRAEIGADPDHIVAGEVLHAPATAGKEAGR